jgi:hypothetical protein
MFILKMRPPDRRVITRGSMASSDPMTRFEDLTSKQDEHSHSSEMDFEDVYVRRLFAEPADKAVRIWRFMDFTKYVAMLHNSGLFFTRCDLLDDQFEGSVPRATREASVRRTDVENTPADEAEKMTVAWSDFNKWLRKWAMINCWHMNECESAAMWKLHTQTNEAIAIVSTYERLRRCLGHRFWIEQVQYIDYERDAIPSGNAMYPFIFKRKSFAHENELRAFTSEFPTKDGNDLDLDKVPTSPGIWVTLDLNDLIETVHIAPKAQPWFFELVCQVSAKYNLRAPVKQSSLDRDPVY